jgi:hypothetical protein
MSAMLEGRWTRDADAQQVSVSWNAVCLFSLLGMVITAAVLLLASDETIGPITAALALM